MNKKNIFLLSILIAILVIGITPFSSAETPAIPVLTSFDANSSSGSGFVCAVYFTGAGCPHCVNAKPVVEKVLNDTPGLVLIRYEVQQTQGNAGIFQSYAESYSLSLGIPLILFGQNQSISGDTPIIEELRNEVLQLKSNPCPLADGTSIPYEELNISSLRGSFDILSNTNVTSYNSNSTAPNNVTNLSFFRIVGLALANSMNACILLVLALILIAVLSANPDKKYKVLMAGLAFAFAVFVTYFIVDTLIVAFIRSISSYQVILHKVFAVLIILLGLLNIRDFLSYVPGRFATEMPIMFRPKVKKIISRVTGPKGAFVIGVITTLFLLPCTIGPFWGAGDSLSSLQLVKALPWIGLYNLVFILPILIITLIIYFGLSSVENVAGWRDKNVKYIHLAAGLLMLILGIAMLAGLL
jgi:cytochrome c biogenesis protein CcdA